MNVEFNEEKNIASSKAFGFTLIELLVVISIIGLLSSIILESLITARQKANDSTKIQAFQQVQKALQLYATDNGYYPATSTNAGLVAALVPKYIGSINSTIKYQSLNINNSVCSASNCPSYHLAISLARTDNAVLNYDKNLNDGTINGTVDNCVSGTASTPNLCYDMTP